MKTTIDAVNEFKGVWPYSCTTMIYCHKSASSHTKGEFLNYDHPSFNNLNTKFFSPVCTKEEFLQCVSDRSSAVIQKPIYTQAMANHNILPLVGMECLYTCIKHQSGKPVIEVGKWYSGTIIAYHDGFVWTSDNGLRMISNTKFKPLTPPIELLDGKPYQFNFADDKVMFGIYNSDRNIFSAEQGTYFDFNRVYNIQLLGVK